MTQLSIEEANAMRDLFFSYSLMKIRGLSRGLLDEKQKSTLALSVKVLQALMEADHIFDEFINATTEKAKQQLYPLAEDHAAVMSIFERAHRQARNPDQTLLIRNRFIIALEVEINALPRDSMQREALAACVKYFDNSCVDATSIRLAVQDALSPMNTQYSHGVPALGPLCQKLQALLDQARGDQHRNKTEKPVTDPFCKKRLMALCVN